MWIHAMHTSVNLQIDSLARALAAAENSAAERENERDRARQRSQETEQGQKESEREGGSERERREIEEELRNQVRKGERERESERASERERVTYLETLMFELADGAAREVQLNAALRELDDEKHVVLVALAQRDAALASSHAATRGGARRSLYTSCHVCQWIIVRERAHK